MNVREMHYNFKLQFNKIDSQNNRNLLVPEIDTLLNQAANLFVMLVAQPRLRTRLGFEVNQKTIEDIRTIVLTSAPLTPVSGVITLPANYQYWVRGKASITKGSCNATARVHPKQHDDMFEESPFDKSSFEWREVTALFDSSGLRVQAEDFTINNVSITYIRKMAYIQNAQDFPGGTYNHPSGQTFTGSQNCELPDQTHPDIVDIAVMLASEDVQTSDYQFRLNKLKTIQII